MDEAQPHWVHWSAFGRPCTGEGVSGDAHHVQVLDGLAMFTVIDALGHGPNAHETAQLLQSELAKRRDTDPQSIVRSSHSLLADVRRAAAIACFAVDRDGEFTYSAAGNVTTLLVNSTVRALPQYSGCAGLCLRSAAVSRGSLERGARVVMFTDGVRRRKLNEAKIEEQRVPGALARRVIYDCTVRTDDSLCLVARYHGD